MCLDRVPFESLESARLVCKKWSSLITIAKVLQKKKENLWFFVFGTACNFTHNPACSYSDVNIIHALHLSRNQWHSINADFLKGRQCGSLLLAYMTESSLLEDKRIIAIGSAVSHTKR